MAIKIPTSISSRFTPQQIQEGLRRADLVARGKPLGDVGGKAVFDALRSVSPEFKRQILSGQLAREGLSLTQFQDIKKAQKQQKIIQDIISRGTTKGISVTTPTKVLKISPAQRTKILSKRIPSVRIFEAGVTSIPTGRTIKGTNVPIMEVVVVNTLGQKVRVATVKERERFQKSQIRTTGDFKIQSQLKKDINELRRIQTKQERGQRITATEQAKLVALTFTVGVIGFIVSLPQLPGTLKSIVEDPSQLKKLPSSIKEEGIKFGRLLKISPTSAVAQIGTEYFILQGTGKALKIIGKLGSRASVKLGNFFRRVKVSQTEILIPQTTAKTIKIKIVGRLGSKSLKAESLAQQLKLIGKRVTGVSAQADELVSIIRKKRIIRKPIPNEELLSKSAKKLLKKFDSGTITPNELIILERGIKSRTGQSLLERSFFADPRGRLRPSRLGTATDREASLFELLTEDVKFKTPKPQVLVFKDIVIQDFPKTKIFKSIKNKLKAGKTLTSKEAEELLKFQLKKSGKFKPIGALSKESEITLAPGEIVKKVKKLGSFISNGKKVNIIQAEVIKVSGKTKKLLSKLKAGKTLTSKELKELNKLVKKKSKGLSSISGRKVGRKFFPLRRKLTSVAVSRLRKLKRRRKPFRKVKRRKKVKKIRKRKQVRKIKRRKFVRKTIKRSVRKPIVPRRPPPTTIRRPPPIIRKPGPPIIAKPIKLKKRKPKRKKKKKQQAYNVFARPLKKRKGQKRPKLKKVLLKPVTRRRARDTLAFTLDQSLARSGRIRKVKGKPGVAPKRIPRGYAKKTKKKFRQFRIKKGKRVALPKRTIIEKRKFIGDTRAEQRGLTLRRQIAQINKPKRKLSDLQLSNLAKGRKILAQKRKK